MNDTDTQTPDTRALVSELRREMAERKQQLADAFNAHPDSEAYLTGRCAAVDAALLKLWEGLQLPPDLALVAVGGYGRGELYPASDVDVLIAVPEQMSADVAARVEKFVGYMWDIGVEPGHAVRTPEQCLEVAENDVTVHTNLIEARLLTGNRTLFERFKFLLRANLDREAFVKAKRLEQDERHQRHHDTPYSLEPNCKESPGGLRDLHTMQWIARACGLGNTWQDLHRHDLITAREARQLHSVEGFLQRLRIRLHLQTGRRVDQLLFDHQEALARRFGVQPAGARRASEVFMQRYYRNAKVITQLNTIVLQNINACLFPLKGGATIYINARFQVTRELLDVRDENMFESQPRALLESFLILQQRPELKGMSARTLRALWRGRHLIDAEFRRDPANRAMFLQLLQSRRGVVHEFRRMNQFGILGRYIPAFGRVVGQMQHDLFHVYTVDQHILMVLRNVRRFTMAEHAHEYPLCTRLITAFERPWLLYVAALFHDIAKGRGGDHSLLGMRDAREFCQSHGISAADTDFVVWLVEHHLTLSQVAQKQDLTDPEVIADFAAEVGDERHLIALYLLTHADIRGTSPKVWNNWKAKLLEDLFRYTMRLLRGALPVQAMGLEARMQEARRLLRFHGLRDGVENELWDEFDTVYFLRHDSEEIAWHTRMLYYRTHGEAPVVRARVNQAGEGLQVMVYAPDQPDLFVRLCGFFSRLGYSIVDAKIHTTRHKYALDSFILLDTNEDFEARDMIGLIEHDLVERLRALGPPDRPTTTRLSRQVRHFPIQPEVSVTADDRRQRHILHVTAADRPGLLYEVAQVLVENGINLHTAKITTLGERVEDTFLVSGPVLHQTGPLLRLEQQLLEKLAI